MTEPTLRPFQPSDVLRIKNRDGEQGLTMQMATAQARAGPAFTAWIGDEPIGCAGIVLPWPGFGIAWMVVSDQLGNYGLWIYRTTKRVVEDVKRAYQLHRLEALAIPDQPRNRRFFEALGLTAERDGKARRYLPTGQDVIRYEWVEE